MLNIGIDEKSRKIVADELIRILADSFILSLKSRHYHWNVTGPFFLSLHKLFQKIYEALDEGGDEIAERIRALGFLAPGSYVEFMSVSAIKEEIGTPKYTDMIHRLISDIEMMIRRIDEVKEIALSHKDDVSADLMIDHLRELSKFAWMLRSHLEN